MRGRASRLLVLLALGCGFALHAGAQVATHSLYQGRLTDATGAAKTGTVAITLRVFSVATAGAHLYQEDHLAVPLGPGGTFAVALGSGTNPDGNYETALQTAAPLYLEVVADGDLLSPRQPIASAPVAAVADSLSPFANRFEACADGLTVADHQTGLLWERKTGTFVSGGHVCETASGGCPEPHDVNNRYQWSSTPSNPDGNVFTDFLAKLNDPFFGAALTSTDVTGCFAGHCDWRIPTVAELPTIDCSNTGSVFGITLPPICDSSSIGAVGTDPAFGPTPNQDGIHWSASRNTSGLAWYHRFAGNFDGNNQLSVTSVTPELTAFRYVRAVTLGSCRYSLPQP